MRVAFVIPSLVIGGAERSLVKTLKIVRPYVDRMSVIILTEAHSALLSDIAPDVDVRILQMGSTANPLLWLRVRRLLLGLQPDVVVGWSMYANFVAVVASGLKPSWKIVVSERTCIPRMLARENTGGLKRFVLLSLLRRLYRRADVVTANSLQSLRFLSKFVQGNSRYSHLPNVIDVREMNLQADRAPEYPIPSVDGPRILGLGRMDPVKGFDVLLEALALVRRRYPWKLLLVGDGPEKPVLQAQAKTLGIADAVIWIGAVQNSSPYYKWADLVVVPSRIEGFPNVPLEAMACGRTVICSDCETGPKELTLNGRVGVLIGKEDPEALARAIMRMGLAPDERACLGSEAKSHVLNTYDAHVNGKVYAEALCLAA
jgi:glycosyltransferase involved in cell wall biosynthesis